MDKNYKIKLDKIEKDILERKFINACISKARLSILRQNNIQEGLINSLTIYLLYKRSLNEPLPIQLKRLLGIIKKYTVFDIGELVYPEEFRPKDKLSYSGLELYLDKN